MKNVGFGGCALTAFAAVAMLSGCGGSGVPLSPSPTGVKPNLRHAPEYSLIYGFKGGKDGAYPRAGVINVNGTLYGATSGGGHRCEHRAACGTVYRIKASGKETVLYRFKGGPADGGAPNSLLNVNGTLYGTAAAGTYGNGTVFAITKSGQETVLYSFKGAPADGASPVGPLLNVNGTLYGTTFAGGAYYCKFYGGCGTVFSITPAGRETVLYSFKGATTDGANPDAGLINLNGTLYGTTRRGGAYCSKTTADAPCGTVFSITPSGKETVLYSFKGGTTDGQSPDAGLIYANGNLYGTATGAGAYNLGTVFAITPSGTETTLHSFGNGNDGAVPQTRLIYVRGKLYGTTEEGGVSCGSTFAGCGTVFSITPSGKENVLHSFGGRSADGQDPIGDLINVNDTLYGTTRLGGSVYCTFSYSYYFGCGSVFSLNP
jgi:uncharacterized repeat protein (TIGR03803 family)